MARDWSFVRTPEFIVGTLVAGVLLNVLAAYLVRALDHVGTALPLWYRRARARESERIQQLVDAAMSDHSLYAALAAEAGRLRSHELLHYFLGFICLCGLLFVRASGELKPGVGISGLLLLIFLVGFGVFQYSRGVDNGRRARRVDAALREVRRKLKLPIMD